MISLGIPAYLPIWDAVWGVLMGVLYLYERNMVLPDLFKKLYITNPTRFTHQFHTIPSQIICLSTKALVPTTRRYVVAYSINPYW